MSRKRVLFALSLALLTPAVQSHADGDRALVLRHTGAEPLPRLLERLARQGGRARHVFQPIAAIVDLPSSSVADWPGVEFVHEPVDVDELAKRGPAGRMAALAWNLEVGNGPHPAPPGPPTPGAGGEATTSPRLPDGLLRPPGIDPGEMTQAPQAIPSGASFWDTSTFMMGSVAVGVFLMESDGSAYNWTSSEINQTLSGIYAAMNWWVDRGGAAAGLSFSYDIHVQYPTAYEPIQMDHADESTWIGPVMDSLGYGQYPDAWSKTTAFNNDLRTSLDTDWAFTLFVVDSSASVNLGRFPDGGYAWAFFGGPWISMARYCSWAYNYQNYFQAVPAHETGHIFFATDEYDQTTSYSGYLYSSDNDGAYCLMNENSLALCNFTPLQIGWRDSDGDGVNDILDTRPQTSLVPYSPDPAPVGSLLFSGTAEVTPYPTSDPYGHDITLNTIVSVDYRIDGGAWMPATATDGTFDSWQEPFSFATSLTAGDHLVEARARNSVGNEDLTPATDSVEVSTVHLLTVSISGGGSVTSSPTGIDCGTDCSQTYADGTAVTLTAAASSGWSFAAWGGACSGTGVCQLTLTSDLAATATFTALPTCDAASFASVTVSGDEEVSACRQTDVGPAVTVADQANLALYAGSTVVIHSGFAVEHGGTVRINTCPQNLCVAAGPNLPLRDGCHPCVDRVCAEDSYCCTTDWDTLCVNEVASICGLVCP